MNPLNDIELDSFLHGLLVPIPGGAIKLRDDRTKQEWTVEIDKFELSRFPVTQAFYKKLTNQSPSTIRGDEKPVETISWIEAIEFCNTLSGLRGLQACYSRVLDSDPILFHPERNGFRLPTEAEWQYACQAGSTEKRYGDLEEIAWYKENSEGSTHDVGKKTPNNWGLYDMLGNVWEWCSDIYDENVYGSYRIFRGGGWCDQERSIMATTRRRSHPYSFKIDDLGFRIAKNINSDFL